MYKYILFICRFRVCRLVRRTLPNSVPLLGFNPTGLRAGPATAFLRGAHRKRTPYKKERPELDLSRRLGLPHSTSGLAQREAEDLSRKVKIMKLWLVKKCGTAVNNENGRSRTFDSHM